MGNKNNNNIVFVQKVNFKLSISPVDGSTIIAFRIILKSGNLQLCIMFKYKAILKP